MNQNRDFHVVIRKDAQEKQHSCPSSPIVLTTLRPCLVNGVAEQEVADGDKGKQKEIESAAFIIEIVREGCDKQQACRQLFAQEHIDERESEEQEEEQPAAENHRLFGVVPKYLCQVVQ